MKTRVGLVIAISMLALMALLGRWGFLKSLHLDSQYFKLTACRPEYTHDQKERDVEYTPRNALITIFVHGNMGLRQHLSLSNIIRFTKDDVHGTQYAKAVSIMRNDPIFFKMQAMQKLGLERINAEYVKPGYASGAMALLFEKVNGKVHEDTTERHYYTFGWSGITTESARYQAAQQLYHALTELVIGFNKDNITPKIRIIGYSHGGNVGLYLGAINEYCPHPFTVDELVLVGTPILVETDHLVHSDIFSRVYHLYSQSDRVQTMDCFSSRRFFSKKTFQSRANFEPPSKLRQIEVRVTGTIHAKRRYLNESNLPSTTHISFISGKARFLRDRSPGHFELWYFGWTPKGYRRKYPLYPLPTVCLTPLIIAEIETYLKQVPHEPQEKLVVDFRPAYGQMIVRKQNNCDHWSACSFLTHNALNELAEMLQAYMPQNFTAHEYQARVKKASRQAKGLEDESYESDTLNTHTAQL